MPPVPVKLNRHPRHFQDALRRWHAHPRVLVEGDSWFQYDAAIPINPTPANLFLGTQEYFRCVALLLARVGDTVAHMLGPYPAFDQPGMPILVHAKGRDNLDRIASYLTPRNRIDVLFFSGGGNDVVDHLAQMLRPYEPNLAARDALIEARVDVQMEAIRQGYRRLLDMRDRVSPRTWVFSHEYGVPNLQKGGFRRLGWTLTQEWIKPQFRRRGYLAPGGEPTGEQLALMTQVIERLMLRFSTVLADILAEPRTRGFCVAPTRAVLAPAHWRDEMHLTDAGFRIAAQTMRANLRQLFPAWAA